MIIIDLDKKKNNELEIENKKEIIFLNGVSQKSFDSSIKIKLLQKAEVKVYGILLAHDENVVNFSIRLEHRSSNSCGFVLIHGIANDGSNIKCHGMIVIEKEAWESESYLKNRMLLLSPQAKVQTTPSLEIKCSKVKASHGVTISELNPEHINYLRSKGIAEKEAKSMLIEAFCSQAFESFGELDKEKYFKRIKNILA